MGFFRLFFTCLALPIGIVLAVQLTCERRLNQFADRNRIGPAIVVLLMVWMNGEIFFLTYKVKTLEPTELANLGFSDAINSSTFQSSDRSINMESHNPNISAQNFVHTLLHLAMFLSVAAFFSFINACIADSGALRRPANPRTNLEKYMRSLETFQACEGDENNSDSEGSNDDDDNDDSISSDKNKLLENDLGSAERKKSPNRTDDSIAVKIKNNDPSVVKLKSTLDIEPKNNNKPRSRRKHKERKNLNVLLKPSERLCDTCFIVRHLRMKHCRMCDLCVPEFDHHCMWINNCVGKGNHRAFIVFLLMTILGLWSSLWAIFGFLFCFQYWPPSLLHVWTHTKGPYGWWTSSSESTSQQSNNSGVSMTAVTTVAATATHVNSGPQLQNLRGSDVALPSSTGLSHSSGIFEEKFDNF